ncbi:MAG: fibronectin type III domain-containing protein [Candidatus Manganitrophus sp. SB1]|nr:fibronectin type III domain-containing protein [Candidatus Manganitrophus morganii]
MKKKILPRYFYSLSLLALLFLTACGGGGGSSSSGGMTPVGIKLKIPAAGNPSSSKAAHAPSPSGVAQVRLSVTDAEGRSLASTTVGVTPGQEVTITLEVPAGRARLFIIEALDSEGTVLFRGEASSDLSPDTPATITVQMVAVEAPPLPTLSLSPPSAFVLLNNSETFTATLTGLEDTSVIWSVDNIDSGNPSVGRITQTNPATYTAPATLPESSVVTVKATSNADPTLFATATVTILTPETTVFIDENGVDGAECGTESSPCRSITRALAQANPGQTVRAAAGTYDDSTETFPIRMKPGVNLIGEDVAETVITSGRSIPVAVIAADNTVLSGFKFDPNNGTIDTLIEIASGGPIISDNRFIDEQNRCEGICQNSHTAIEVNGGSPLIQGNEFRGFGFTSTEEPITAAILVQNDAAPTIDQNTLRENRLGIALLDGAAPSIERNTITNNQTGISVAGSAAPYLGGTTQENSGGNVLSCNTTVDLTVADTVQPFYARRNQWDHLPPTVSSQPGSGIDIVANENVDIDGATAVTPHCLTEPPTVPAGLLATAMSQNLIRLSWTASIDNFGEVTYQIERCPGTNCTSFEHIAQTTETTFDDIGRSPATSYTYRIRAMDVNENLSTYSNISSATTPDQDAPTAPSNLTANTDSETEINLSWGASADDVAVAGYRVERCQGAGCTNFVEIAQPIAPNFNNAGLSPGVSYSYRVRAVDAANNFSGYSNTATDTTLDTSDPTAPTGLTAAAVSETQINLSWQASTDNVGVTEYRLERCSGASCTNFAEIGRPTATTFNDGGRSVATAYRYRVRASDAAGNFSGYSNIATATTPDNTAPTPPANLAATPVSGTQINLSWNASTDNVGVTEYRIDRCQGVNCANFAQIATSPTTSFNNTGLSPAVSYSYRVRAVDAATNLGGFSNTATAVTRDTIAPTAPTNLTATPAGETQINLSWGASSDNIGVAGYRVERCQGTTCANFVEVAQPTGATFNDTGRSAGASYVYRVRAVDAAGNLSGYSSTAGATTPDNSAPTAPTNLTAATVGETQINLSWTASTDNVGLAGYRVERCQGSNCTNFAEIAQPTATTFNDPGRSAGTLYSYRVRAIDTANNFSGFSNIATAATQDTTAPTAPTNLAANPVSGSQINLSWGASTDNVGVTGYRVERCQGATCSNFAEISQPTTTSFNDTGRSPGVSYRYRVRGVDAGNNFSGYSNIASATTPDTTAPTSPTNLAASPVSGTQINLSWNASTDNVGVTEYRIERCQGANCANFAQIATSGTNSFNNTGLSQATLYSYRVRAVDAAGNLSGFSNTATAATRDITSPTAPSNLTARVVSEVQINLSWGAATDNVGVTGYRVERCQGANCTNFVEIGQPAATSFNNTGLTAGILYRYRARAIDAAGNFSGYSNIAAGFTDVTPPTTPTGLSGRGLNQSEIGLSWGASTDNVGVVGYRLERCLATGASCVEIDTGSAIDPTKPSFNDTGLATATAYTYRIRAYDAAGNLSLYSQSAGASTGRILFRASFDIGNLDQPPETTLIGDPVGDSLSLSTSAGTILVRSFVGNMDTRPVELNQIAERTGGVDLRGTVAGTPPKSGIYTARWRSLVASREVGFAAIVLRDSAGRIVASLAYRPNNILDYNDRTPSNGIGVFWRQNFAQTFEIEVDLNRKTTLLRIDGRIVMESVPFYEAAAADLARISMELGMTSAQTLAWDDIDITATVP